MMQPLDKTLRNQLERAVKDARDIAEEAACAALEQLGVGEAAPFAHLSEQDQDLRRKLCAHGRQLGDTFLPSPNGRGAEGRFQALDRLIEETAYEHWHRMLFARFLAENNLLMYPDPDEPVAITLEECEDLAADENAANGWELAARFAAHMLPQIFRPDSPVFQLILPPEHQQKLERLLTDLPSEIFTASDSLGWVYQFWQAKRKDEINASEVKIGARELPAVTQLFTEPYMVNFLLDNSLGAWWVGKVAGLRRRDAEEIKPGAREVLQTAKTEEELREFFAIPGVPLTYLRFVKTPPTSREEREQNALTPTPLPGGEGLDDSLPSPSGRGAGGEGKRGEVWTPAAGIFAAWPEHLADLKTLDPCCGSGHFLVAAFLMLVPMRMELEGLPAREAADAVLRENLHGLELDQRCVALAAFALALAAWTYPDAGGYRLLPELHLACSGLSVSVAKEEWKQLGLGKKNLAIALGWMHDTFGDAPALGSLLNPAKTDAARLVQRDDLADELSSALEQALKREQGEEQHEVAVVAQGLAKAATLLTRRYQWIITNVPYLARGKQGERLREFCEKHYPEAKNDLATVFLERCLRFSVQGGTSSVVLPQNWLFLTSYRKFREKLLKNDTWHLIARLGAGAFETISGEVVQAVLINLSHGNALTPTLSQGERGQSLLPLGEGARRADEGKNLIRGLDVSEPRTADEKAALLLTAEIQSVEQAKQLENPDARVTLEEVQGDLLENYAISYKGITTGDDPKYRRSFWDFDRLSTGFKPFQSTVTELQDFGGCESFVWYEAMTNPIQPGVYLRAGEAMGRKGLMVSQMRQLPVAQFLGTPFDTNAGALIPKTEEDLPAIWCFCSSPEYNEAVRRIDQKLNVTNATLVKVPFDLDHWTQVAEEKYPNGLPQLYSDDPTQWIFHGHPCGSVIWDEERKWTAHGPLRTDHTVLHVAVARLLDYRWPAETSPLNPLSMNGEGTSNTSPLNPLSTDGERTSSTSPLNPLSMDGEGTSSTSPLNPLSTNGEGTFDTEAPPSPFMEKGAGGMRLAEEQREWVRRCEALADYADKDGIVCIPPVRGEAQAADRLLNLLVAAYNYALTPTLSQGERGQNALTPALSREERGQNALTPTPLPGGEGLDNSLPSPSGRGAGGEGKKDEGAWKSDTLATLLKNADHAGKTLETWLRDKFFIQHCKLFQHRPFIWHIWDGLRDGFAALVNYHKLDAKLLETLIYTYLGDWISRQKQDIAAGVDGAEERLAAAENLKKKLELIRDGEAPYDIFVRWKPLEQQPIGWNPDLNDGVRLNIRPFLSVPDVGKKGAGCLRDKPNIKWNKDRGKDVESAPWYHLGPEYGGQPGDRINDHHLTLEEKRKAREAAE
jgi:hypothetical protein